MDLQGKFGYKASWYLSFLGLIYHSSQDFATRCILMVSWYHFSGQKELQVAYQTLNFRTTSWLRGEEAVAEPQEWPRLGGNLFIP